MSEPVWLIEMQGPSYLSVEHVGGYEFQWTDDVFKAIQFKQRHHADFTMMAIRQLRGDLFPSCLPRTPRAVEHIFIDGKWMAQPMIAWSRARPTESGWYWWTTTESAVEPELVHFVSPGIVLLAGSNKVYSEEDMVNALSRSWWLGPLPVPLERPREI